MTSILESIDGALYDWETSPDAMRWSPRLAKAKERAVADAPALALRPGLSLAGPEGPWAVVDSSMFFSDPGTSLEEIASLRAGILRIADVSGCVTTCRACFSRSSTAAALTCHPERKPKPLAVDGHAYQRRLRHRRRRRRH